MGFSEEAEKEISMFNKFKATIKRLVDLPANDFLNLIGWSSTGVDATNPDLLIASATDERGAVAYTTVEPTFIVNGYAFRPRLSNEACGHAGNAIYDEIQREAKARGVEQVWIVLPSEVPTQHDEKLLRVIPLKVPTHEFDQPVPDVRVSDSPSAWIN